MAEQIAPDESGFKAGENEYGRLDEEHARYVAARVEGTVDKMAANRDEATTAEDEFDAKFAKGEEQRLRGVIEEGLDDKASRYDELKGRGDKGQEVIDDTIRGS